MRTLRFHAELYSGAAIEAALGEFAEYAAVSNERLGDYHVVTIDAAETEDEEALAGALANYALAATIERRE